MIYTWILLVATSWALCMESDPWNKLQQVESMRNLTVSNFPARIPDTEIITIERCFTSMVIVNLPYNNVTLLNHADYHSSLSGSHTINVRVYKVINLYNSVSVPIQLLNTAFILSYFIYIILCYPFSNRCDIAYVIILVMCFHMKFYVDDWSVKIKLFIIIVMIN